MFGFLSQGGQIKRQLFREGTKSTKQKSQNMPANLGKSSEKKKVLLRKENGSFLVITSALLKKKPRCCNIFQGRISSQMEERALTSRKGETWGFEAASARGGERGSEPRSSLLGAGASLFPRQQWLPLGGPSAETASRLSPSPIPAPPSPR